MAKGKKDIEIEIKVQLEKSKKLLDFLKRKAKFIGENHQIDRYFTPAHRDFLKFHPANEWLRLRDSSGKYSINYKKWHREKDGKANHCDEYETKVEDVKQLENIFKVLNMKPLVTVDKIRKIWLYKNYEIAVDLVKGLGSFVEVEFKGSSHKTPKVITTEMVAFLKTFDCGKITRDYVGYPFALLFPKETVKEEY